MFIYLVVKFLTHNTTPVMLKEWVTFTVKNEIKSIDGFEAFMSKVTKEDANKFFNLIQDVCRVRITKNDDFAKYFEAQKIQCFTEFELKLKCHKKLKHELGRCLTHESSLLFGRSIIAHVEAQRIVEINLCLIGIDSIVTVIRLLLLFHGEVSEKVLSL